MKSKKTKKALTGSVLALVLCFVMLLGTTFAWFTDTASTSVNKIESGTLKIEFQMATAWDANGKPTMWEDAEGKSLGFVVKQSDGTYAVGQNVLWEPGCEYKLQELRVKNAGSLALKAKLEITGINGDAKLNEVIDWKWTAGVDHSDGTYSFIPELMQSAGITVEGADENGYSPLSTLGEQHLQPTDGWAYVRIVGQMQTTAGNEYQNQKIDSVAITVLATQWTFEADSNNNQYDKTAEYPIYVPAGGLDTTATSENVTTITDSELFEDEITNAYVIDGGTYCAQDDFATFNNTYSTVWIKDADISCKTLLCAFAANNTIVLSDCNITIADGGYLIKELSGQPTQVIFANVTINGEKVTSSNFNTVINAYCTGTSISGFVLY